MKKILLLLLVVMLAVSCEDNPSVTHANFACEDFIRDYMEDPNDLFFLEPRGKEVSNNHFRVLYRIMSKNVFGEDITYIVACNLHYKKEEGGDINETSSWELDDMVFVDEDTKISMTAFRNGKRYIEKMR